MRQIHLALYLLVVATFVHAWLGFGEAAEDTTTTTEAPTTTISPKEADEIVTTTPPSLEKTPSGNETEEVDEIVEAEEWQQADQEYDAMEGIDFYMFTAKDMSDADYSLETYRGYVTLVVNVASKCGYTDAGYKELVALQEKFEPTGYFTVLAFPCNQFWDQEPGTNEEIFNFAVEKYGANFPIFAKSDVTGDNASDAWHYLAQVTGYAPQWNFWKYLIDQNGHVVDVWSHETSASELEGWIEDTISKAINQAEGYEQTGEYPDYDGDEFFDEEHHHEHGDEL